MKVVVGKDVDTMRRSMALLALTGILMAGVSVISGVSASATETATISCEVEQGGHIYRLYSWATYEDSSATGIREWTSFHYMVTGGRLEESHNNVNIRLSESGVLKFRYDSPDSLRYNTWYSTAPDTPAITSIWGPEGEHDHRRNDVLRFEGIFDYSGLSDPRCTTEHRR